jgi:hypothetical protein
VWAYIETHNLPYRPIARATFFAAACPRCAERFERSHKLLILMLFRSQSVQSFMTQPKSTDL